MRNFNQTFNIGGRPVGLDAPVLIIAEAGVAHFGSIDKAYALVDLAVEAGADVFKTQAFSTDSLISEALPEWRDRLRPKEVDFAFIEKMKRRADDAGIIFMCTAHDEVGLDWINRMDVAAYKVGSGERGNFPFLGKMAEAGKPIVLSTGMYREADIAATLDFLDACGVRDLALLHCITSYPTPYEQLNLPAITRLQEIFAGPVGYSDHTDGHHGAVAAVALGAKLVEKHITLDFDVPNAQDWKVSCGPDDFADFVSAVRQTEAAMARHTLDVMPCETDALTWALKSLVAKSDLPAGTRLTKDMLSAKRPGSGISPAEIDKVVGRRLRTDLARETALTWEALEE